MRDREETQIYITFPEAPSNALYFYVSDLLLNLEELYYALYQLKEKRYRGCNIFLRNCRKKLAKETNLRISYLSYSSPIEIKIVVNINIDITKAFIWFLILIAYNHIPLLRDKHKHKLLPILLDILFKNKILSPKDSRLIEDSILEKLSQIISLIKRIAEIIKYFGKPNIQINPSNENREKNEEENNNQ